MQIYLAKQIDAIDLSSVEETQSKYGDSLRYEWIFNEILLSLELRKKYRRIMNNVYQLTI